MSIPSSEGGGGGGGLLLVDGLFGSLSMRAYMSPVQGPWTCWIGLSSVFGFFDLSTTAYGSPVSGPVIC